MTKYYFFLHNEYLGSYEASSLQSARQEGERRFGQLVANLRRLGFQTGLVVRNELPQDFKPTDRGWLVQS